VKRASTRDFYGTSERKHEEKRALFYENKMRKNELFLLHEKNGETKTTKVGARWNPNQPCHRELSYL